MGWCQSSVWAPRPWIGQVLGNELLFEIGDATGRHTAPHPTLTSNHATENPGREGHRNTHSPKVSLRQNPVDKLGSCFSLQPNILHHFLLPCRNPTEIRLPMQPPSGPKNRYCTPTIQAFQTSHCLFLHSLPPSTQAQSILLQTTMGVLHTASLVFLISHYTFHVCQFLSSARLWPYFEDSSCIYS